MMVLANEWFSLVYVCSVIPIVKKAVGFSFTKIINALEEIHEIP